MVQNLFDRNPRNRHDTMHSLLQATLRQLAADIQHAIAVPHVQDEMAHGTSLPAGAAQEPFAGEAAAQTWIDHDGTGFVEVPAGHIALPAEQVAPVEGRIVAALWRASGVFNRIEEAIVLPTGAELESIIRDAEEITTTIAMYEEGAATPTRSPTPNPAPAAPSTPGTEPSWTRTEQVGPDAAAGVIEMGEADDGYNRRIPGCPLQAGDFLQITGVLSVGPFTDLVATAAQTPAHPQMQIWMRHRSTFVADEVAEPPDGGATAGATLTA